MMMAMVMMVMTVMMMLSKGDSGDVGDDELVRTLKPLGGENSKQEVPGIWVCQNWSKSLHMVQLFDQIRRRCQN